MGTERFAGAVSVPAAVLALLFAGHAFAADFLIDVRDLEKINGVPDKRAVVEPLRVRLARSKQFWEYRVKRNENVHQILVKRFEYSNSEADTLSKEVLRLNGIENKRGVHSGDIIFVPKRTKQ